MSDPVIITRQTKANGVAMAWKAQYTTWTPRDKEKTAILDKLLALGAHPDPDEVNLVIGNSSWTDVGTCHGCGKNNPPILIQVGQEPDYESGTADLCAECLGRAMGVLLQHVNSSQGHSAHAGAP